MNKHLLCTPKCFPSFITYFLHNLIAFIVPSFSSLIFMFLPHMDLVYTSCSRQLCWKEPIFDWILHINKSSSWTCKSQVENSGQQMGCGASLSSYVQSLWKDFLGLSANMISYWISYFLWSLISSIFRDRETEKQKDKLQI